MVGIEQEVLVQLEADAGAFLDRMVEVARPHGVTDVHDVDAGRTKLLEQLESRTGVAADDAVYGERGSGEVLALEDDLALADLADPGLREDLDPVLVRARLEDLGVALGIALARDVHVDDFHLSRELAVLG